MHIKVPFLAVLIISIFQTTLYGIQNNHYSRKDFNEILTVQPENITEIRISNFSGHGRHTTDPEQIKDIFNYFNQFQYQRLRNDQTAFMPKRTMMINIYAGENIDFIIPYGKEAFINHKVYRVKNGVIEQDLLLEIFHSLPDTEKDR